jgi:putative phosphoesterase
MRILIVSDIHGNWPALRAVLEEESKADKVLCLGDLVDYGPCPKECVSWARSLPTDSWVMQGNHDRGVARRENPKCSPPYRHLTKATQEFSIRLLAPTDLQFLRDLQARREFLLEGSKCLACHATPRDPLYRYVRATDDACWEVEIAAARFPDYLFVGHTHWSFHKRIGQTVLVNPGSVGQPKDGDPRAAYAIWIDGDIFLRKTWYNIEETRDAFGSTGLAGRDVESLVHVLRTGGALPNEGRFPFVQESGPANSDAQDNTDNESGAESFG